MTRGVSAPDLPRCGASTRHGGPCRRPAVANGPCAYHDPRRTSPADAWRTWSLPRRFQLMGYMERGWDDERIARRLGTTAVAVKLTRQRYGLGDHARAVLTARAVARRLGLGCVKTVTQWIEHGWLAGHRGRRQGRSRTYVIRESAVLAFLEDPRHWHRYDADAIADDRWRAYGRTCRGDVRLLRAGEAASIACVAVNTISQWIRKGWLPATKRGSNWFARSDDLAVTLERRDRTGSPASAPAGVEMRRRRGRVASHEDAA